MAHSVSTEVYVSLLFPTTQDCDVLIARPEYWRECVAAFQAFCWADSSRCISSPQNIVSGVPFSRRKPLPTQMLPASKRERRRLARCIRVSFASGGDLLVCRDF